MSKHNAKALLTELLQFYASIPDSREKHELDRIITMMRLGKSDLKTILLIINRNLDREKSSKGNKTVRDMNIQIWSYILSILTKYLRSSK